MITSKDIESSKCDAAADRYVQSNKKKLKIEPGIIITSGQNKRGNSELREVSMNSRTSWPDISLKP